MTPTDDPQDHLPEATAAEELASALLDGAVADDAPGASGAEVLEARAAFERVARAVAAPVDVDDEQRERTIAAALDAWPGVTPAIDDLAARRRARRGLQVAGIAAAVLAAVGLAGVAALRDTGSSDDTAAATADDTFDAEAAEEADGFESGGSTGGSSSAASGLAVFADLGDYDDLEALVADADADADTQRGAPTTTVAAGADAPAAESAPDSVLGGAAADATSTQGCTAPDPPPGELRSTATARLEGRPVIVVVVDGERGRVVQVHDAVTCEVLFAGSP